MKFENSFFEGETRNGFYIRPMMKRFWAAGMEVLEVIAEICKRHDIKWFAEGGTLLGAVREQGFIAWDDDIDISMLRKDYERFRHYAKTEFPEGWLCYNERGDRQNGVVCHASNSSQIRTDPMFLSRFHGCPYISGVDIFVYDNLPRDSEKLEQYINLLQIAWGLAEKVSDTYEDTDAEVKEMIEQLELISGVRIDLSRNIKGQLYTLMDSIAAMYMDQDSENIAIAGWLLEDLNNIFCKEWFSETQMMPFEGMDMPVPIHYNHVLEKWYGKDYMIPKQVKAGHDYPAYGSQERLLRAEYEKRGIAIPDYFDM